MESATTVEVAVVLLGAFSDVAVEYEGILTS